MALCWACPVFVAITEHKDELFCFAIGIAFQAASGLSCDLKQEELRQHLKENFDTGIQTPFPTTTSGKKTKCRNNSLLCMLFASRV